MKLNLQILFDELAEVYSYHFPENMAERELATFSIYTPYLKLRKDTLYLVYGTKGPDLSVEDYHFFYIIKEREKSKTHFCGNYLAVVSGGKSDISDWLRTLEGIFRKYDLWEEELRNALLKKRTVSYLCKLAQKMFQNPILVHNPEYRVLTLNEPKGMSPHEPLRDPQTNYIPDSMIKELIFRRDYLNTFDYTTPQDWQDEDGTPNVYMNLFSSKGEYLGRIVVEEVQVFGFGIKALVAFFAKYLEIAIQNDRQKQLNTLSVFKDSCVRYLNDRSHFEKEKLKTELLLYGWSPSDTFFCINLQVPPASVKMNVTPYESQLFSQYMLNCLTLNYQEELVMIFNLSKSRLTQEEECSKIAYVVRENLLVAGISTEFSNFFDFPDYYKQAQAARTTGRRLYPTKWLFKFEDIMLKHILLNGSDSLPLCVLIPENLQKLKECDRLYGTEYYGTLRNFILYDKKTADAIESLYIHRSTFKSRMKKIKEKLALNLDDPDVIFYLKIIIHLLESGEERRENKL